MSVLDRFAIVSSRDRSLTLVLAAVALTALLLGILGGFLTALVRAGFIETVPEMGYQFLTLHGVSVFFYWLNLAQVALLLGFAAVEGESGRLAWRWPAATGALFMILGFGFTLTGAVMGTPPLYDGAPALLGEEPKTLAVFDLGYVLLGLGLVLTPAAAIATLFGTLRRERQSGLSAMGACRKFSWLTRC